MSKSLDNLEKKYKDQKALLDNIRSNATIEKWKILSKAYKMGKILWGRNFTRERLAYDMDMAMTTVLRCLSLDRANKRTWRLIKEKKISAYKAAQICYSKSSTVQDLIVDFIIENNVSTCKIKSLNINNVSDVSKEKHKLACENGYSKKSSAYSNFNSWIGRGKLFLLMDQKHLPKGKIPGLQDGLKKLYNNLGIYLKNYEVIE